MIRVVIAEDHNLIREALIKMLHESKKIDVVGEAATGATAVSMTKRHKPDVLLLDVTMPEKDGLQALAELVQLHVSTKVLVLTMHEDEAHGVRAMRAGATGFLRKSASMDELVTAIEKVNKGEQVVPTEILAALNRNHLAVRGVNARTGLDGLTGLQMHQREMLSARPLQHDFDLPAGFLAAPYARR